MSDEEVTYFGIDLGTTYSVIAYVDDTGRPTVVRSSTNGLETTPSAVYFENADSVVVGEAAKNVARVYPDRVVQRIKRDMGRDAPREFDGRTYPPESISSLILRQLAQDAAAETRREVHDVVITVPAYFGMLECEATRQAGGMAGLNVVGIVPEPVAAALQYDVRAADGERTVLVYDLGGGTFDTTVIRITPTEIDVVCTDGNQKLGGVDWDDRLIEYLVDEFRRTAGPDLDPADDEHFMQELATNVEDLKRQLSQVTSRSVPLRYAGATAMVEVTRDTFEQITKDLLDDTLTITDRTLATFATIRGITDPARHIDDVLLVGGSTFMPAVRARLTERYGWEPRLHDPHLAVAKGAAKFALSRAVWPLPEPGSAATPLDDAEREARLRAVSERTSVPVAALEELARKSITGVLPKAFGVRLIDATISEWAADPDAASFIKHLVHANDKLPSGPRELEAATVMPHQREIQIEIYEQAGATESRELAANKPVDNGSGMITGLPDLPAGSPVDITMNVDQDGKLKVVAVERTTGKKLEIDVRVSVLSEEAEREAHEQVRGLRVRS